MQAIICERPYRFVHPHRGDWVPSLIQSFRLVDVYLNRLEGIHSHEIRGAEKLKQSLQEDCGVLIAPNHCRYADPIAIGWLARAVDVHIYAMASWHLFNQSRLQAFAIRMCGGFSVYREGVDRQSLDTAIDVLTEARRPLVVFPEGTVFRSNDLVQPLLEGVSFIARTAARRRAKRSGGGVVIHPVAIKYLFKGDLCDVVQPVLNEIEQRFTFADHHWNQPGRQCSAAMREWQLIERLPRLYLAVLALKEIEYLGDVQSGTLEERQRHLVEHLLKPLEERWLEACPPETLMGRVKRLRTQLVPELTGASIRPERRQEIWADLTDIYVAQQIAAHPVHYLDQPTDTRILESVERLEEDLTDRSRIHRPLHVILEVGDAMEVEPVKAPRRQEDPLLTALRERLQSRLNALSREARAICRPDPTSE